jgi:hypothetical protein
MANAVGIAEVSDVALMNQLQKAEGWLRGLCVSLLQESGWEMLGQKAGTAWARYLPLGLPAPRSVAMAASSGSLALDCMLYTGDSTAERSEPMEPIGGGFERAKAETSATN